MAATSAEAKERTEVRMLHLTFESLLPVQMMVASHLSSRQGVNPIVSFLSTRATKAEASGRKGEGRCARAPSGKGEVGLPVWPGPPWGLWTPTQAALEGPNWRDSRLAGQCWLQQGEAR